MNLLQRIITNRWVSWTARLFLFGYLALLTAPFIASFLPGGFVGRVVAKRDVARSYFAIRHHGTQVFWRRDYKERLEDQYGIKALGVPGSCVVSHFTQTFDAEYNRVQRAAIIAHFGRDVVKEVDDEARAAWEEKRKQFELGVKAQQ